MKLLFQLATILFLSISLSGCSEDKKIDLSAEKIVDKALNALQEPVSYYGEFEGNDGEYNDWRKFKEWAQSDGRTKVKRGDRLNETVDMYDGEKMFLYDAENHMVAAFKRSYGDMAFSSRSIRLRSGSLLEFAKENCELSVGRSEKVAGRDTYHIVSKSDGDKACMGVPEYWIDQENWMVLKFSQNYHDDQRVTLQYTKIDFEADISDAELAFDFPESAGVNIIVDPEESTVEEAIEKLGEFYQVPETAQLQLSKVTIYEEKKERPEFTFDYSKEGEPEISVSVFPSAGEIDFSVFEDEEIITINGQKRIILGIPEDLSILWMEGGLHYTASSTADRQLSKEELVEYVASMMLVQ